MTSRTITEARKAQAQASIAKDVHEMKDNHDAMMQWMASYMVATHELLQTIGAALNIAPPLDGDEGEGTPPTLEPEKPKRGRPRKEKTDG